MKTIKIKLLLKIILIDLIFELFLNINIYYLNFTKKNDLKSINTFFLYDMENIKSICQSFKIFDIKYFYSFKFNMVKIEYKIGFYNINNNIIEPSDLTLHKKFHLFCFIEIKNNSYNNTIIINSIPNIHQNSFYKCTEFYNINEKIKIGIKIYKREGRKNNFDNNQIFIDEKAFNYNKMKFIRDEIFDVLIINNKYQSLIEKINNENLNQTLKLKKSYMKFPLCLLKRFSIGIEKWSFLHLYDEYFCSCKGINCLNIQIQQNCKYYLYLNIIDNNRNVYIKTDILFVDFIFAELSSDDAFPVFKKMIDLNYPVHYITENKDIYNEFCHHQKICLSIILVNKENYKIDGDFLEKYLTLFLKLKQVISGGGIYFSFVNNIFYNIEYITFISITHGVCLFKYFLYEDYACYGKRRINKIVIPPSNIVISVAKKYGWKDTDIIKLNLPKWDKFNQNYNLSFDLEKKINFHNNSIFLLFTWRDLKNNKKISSHYFKNIIYFLVNKILIEALKKKNSILYFSIHHKVKEYNKYKNKYLNNQVIKFVEIKEISECLSKTSLVVTDFSSIIFDLIYKRKPYILYIPDANDPYIEDIYINHYYELIQSMKNGTIFFENLFFDINETINKIIFYLNNNFTLDIKLINFYDNLGIKSDNNIDKFIKYIINLN